MGTPRKYIIAKFSIRKLGSSLVLSDESANRKLCNSISTRRFNKAKLVYCIRHTNVQETYVVPCGLLYIEIENAFHVAFNAVSDHISSII